MIFFYAPVLENGNEHSIEVLVPKGTKSEMNKLKLTLQHAMF